MAGALPSSVPIASGSRSLRVAGILAVAGLLVALAIPAARAGDAESERAGLRRSWQEACARYNERIDWATRQACNLAWFRAHERDVYRNNLNPHGSTPAAPSS